MLGKLWQDILELLNQYGGVYLQGIVNTLVLATVATLLGCVIGFFCGLLQTIPHPETDPLLKRFFLALIRVVIRIYVEVFRGTPMILQAVFIFYGLPYFTNNALQFGSLWGVSIFVVSINTGAYIAESVRGGIISVDPGQAEGATAIGMSHFQAMLYVILPQALRNILPQIGNNFIINIKDTSVMFIIGFSEFFAVHKMVSGAVFKYFPSATIERVGLGKASGRRRGLPAGQRVRVDERGPVGDGRGELYLRGPCREGLATRASVPAARGWGGRDRWDCWGGWDCRGRKMRG